MLVQSYSENQAAFAGREGAIRPQASASPTRSAEGLKYESSVHCDELGPVSSPQPPDTPIAKHDEDLLEVGRHALLRIDIAIRL
jgi:hypothetical protein